MDSATVTQPRTADKARKEATRKQIRGSSLLLLGRLFSVGLNFTSQVFIVRYLSNADYGAWAYALSAVAFCQGFAVLGLDRAITRFVPIYHENAEYNKMFGTIILVVGSILLTGLLFILGLYAAPEEFARLLGKGGQRLDLLFVLIFLVPVDATDGLLIGLFASFASPRAIFFRKHVLGPALKLTVVLMLIYLQSSVLFLAYGWLGASLIGIIIYFFFFARLLQKKGLTRHFRLRQVQVPAREIFGFTIPLMTSDLVSIVMHSLNVMILGYFYDTSEIALFKVVLPAAQLNKIVMRSFALLYTPLAARMFARKDYAGINDLYWRTAIWLSVLSFPVFAATFSIAKPLTVFLYTSRYEQSGLILALLSLGFYFNVVLGFNGLTLKVLGKIRYIVIINILAVVINVAANLVLIAHFGALGAAIGMSSSMILHNILKQAGLRLVSGINIFDKTYLPFYVLIGTSALCLFVVQFYLDNIYAALTLAALLSAIVFQFSKKRLNVKEHFPELMKIPGLGRFLG